MATTLVHRCQHSRARERAEFLEHLGLSDAYDEQSWQAFLTDNGPYWNGAEESWGDFTQWFLHHAEERALKDPATALIDYLDQQSALERIATLAQERRREIMAEVLEQLKG